MVRRKKRDFYLSLPGNIGTKFRNSQRYTKKKKRSRCCYKKQKETNEEPATGNFLLQSGFPKSVLSSVASFFYLNDGIFFEIVHSQPQYIIFYTDAIRYLQRYVCCIALLPKRQYIFRNRTLTAEIYFTHTHNTIFTDTTNFYRYDTV
jgi:hypothetical protein